MLRFYQGTPLKGVFLLNERFEVYFFRGFIFRIYNTLQCDDGSSFFIIIIFFFYCKGWRDSFFTS